ncbi:MAG: hypothetical protein K0B81_07905 [Candidatus Cloacimonetes bacterium]|nr:hypothetical protein [Candidatus Cloacimonadota bacterium]
MSLKHQYKEELKKSIQEEMKVELHSKNNQRTGLCADCVRAESCSLSNNTEAAIWNCEDYENEEVAPIAAESKVEAKMEAMADAAVEANPGLCPYCIHNENCSLKKVEGGIWHCEEYA